MMYLLRQAGFDVSGETNGASVVLLNTCGFIEEAKTEAIEAILHFAKDKTEGKIGKLIVAGCLPERYKSEIMLELPEIDCAIGVGSFDEIATVVRLVLESKEKLTFFGDINKPVSEESRIITTSPVWAYLKIAEGCDNRCSYCIIPEIRGRFRSRPMTNIINEARQLVQGGIKELILVAQDLTRYGADLSDKYGLAELLNGLCEIEGLRWLRLHYLYPHDIDDALIDSIAAQDKILKYLDIPIQHVSDSVLHKMNRRGSGNDIRNLFLTLRERIPGVVLRTSIITGLPGEGQKEFEEICRFLEEMKIERAGLFTYSPEEGTAAALMERPDRETAAKRTEILSEIQRHVMDEFNNKRLGSETTVLVEGFEDGLYYGRSYAESPDIDGYIRVRGEDIVENDFIDVVITGVIDGELVGERPMEAKQYEYRE